MKISKVSDIKKENVNLENTKNVKIQWLISKNDGAENFHMRLFEVEKGGHTPLHSHSHEHEVFILRGTGKFVCEEKVYDLQPESVIFVPPNKKHQFKNSGDKVLKFLCIIPAIAG